MTTKSTQQTPLPSMLGRRFARVAAVVLLLSVMSPPTRAQSVTEGQAQPPIRLAQAAPPAVAPQTAAPKKPRRVLLRFLTESTFPPFNFLDEDGVLTGFNVDLARAICLAADVQCDIKELGWDELLVALRRGDGDAVIAAHRVTPELLRQVDFTDRYFYTPGRFVSRKKGVAYKVTADGLADKRIAVAAGTAHEAYLRTFFGDARIETFTSPDKAREAVRDGRVDLVFGDAISLAFWLNGALSRQCCQFRGGPFMEPRYFGDGLAIAVKRGDDEVRAIIDQALATVRTSGRMQELVNRYFPFQIF